MTAKIQQISWISAWTLLAGRVDCLQHDLIGGVVVGDDGHGGGAVASCSDGRLCPHQSDEAAGLALDQQTVA